MKQQPIAREPDYEVGEYTMALNWTRTKAIEKTMPLSAIMPDATADR